MSNNNAVVQEVETSVIFMVFKVRPQVLEVPSWESLTGGLFEDKFKYSVLREVYEGYTKYPSDMMTMALRGFFILALRCEGAYIQYKKLALDIESTPEDLCDYARRILETQMIPKLGDMDTEDALDRGEAASLRMNIEELLQALPLAYKLNKPMELTRQDVRWSEARMKHGGYGYGGLPTTNEYMAQFAPCWWWTN